MPKQQQCWANWDNGHANRTDKFLPNLLTRFKNYVSRSARSMYWLRITGKWKCRMIAVPVEQEKPLGMPLTMSADTMEKVPFSTRYPCRLVQLQHVASLPSRSTRPDNNLANFINSFMKLLGTISELFWTFKICKKKWVYDKVTVSPL